MDTIILTIFVMIILTMMLKKNNKHYENYSEAYKRINTYIPI